MRLIDADALASALNNGRLEEQTGRAVPFNAGVAFALTMVEYAPTIDAVPVRHGRWEKNDDYTCSLCGYRMVIGDGAYNYCPNCGARMDGDDNEID